MRGCATKAPRRFEYEYDLAREDKAVVMRIPVSNESESILESDSDSDS